MQVGLSLDFEAIYILIGKLDHQPWLICKIPNKVVHKGSYEE